MTGIYKITNNLTQECYIGQSVYIERRWQEHKNRYPYDTAPLYQAMRQYGIDNFSWEIVETCLPEELNEKEKYWIKYYNSFKEGYNATNGGQGTIVDYSIIYKLWDEGLTISEIAEQIPCALTTVRNALHGYSAYSVKESHKRGGLQAYKTAVKNNGNKDDDTLPTVFQYALDGKFIQAWKSTKEVQRELGINAASIGKVMRNKRLSAGGFRWSREYFETLPQLGKKPQPAREVFQYSLNNEFIQAFPSIAAAAKAVNGDASLIRRILDSETKTAYNYKWKTTIVKRDIK